MRTRVSLFALPLLCLAVPLFAQTPTGILQGEVTDQSAASIANANVHLTDAATNESRSTTTDSGGRFVFPLVPPGKYNVSVDAAGFNTAQEENVTIDVAQNRSVNFRLTVGNTKTEITVDASAAALDTNTSSLDTVVTTRDVVDLPLNGRNPFALAELSPGVNNVGGGSTPHIGGSRNSVSEEQIDGITNITPENNVGNNGAAYTPVVDSVQEFSVQYNDLSAEYGRFGGGVINLVTKSGTNHWHGDLYEFNRDAVLDANDFFSNSAGQGKPSLLQNQFGGTLGGPITIPKVYNGRDRTFFFFGYEGTRAQSFASETDTVPLTAFKTGDFSQLGTTIYDPLTVHQLPDGSYARNPFPNNIIPANRLNPVAVAAIGYFPSPNQGAPGQLSNNYYTAGTTSNVDDHFDARIDHTFSSKWRAFLRFSHDWNNSTQLEDFSNAASQGYGGPTNGGSWSASMDHTITLSPTLILDLRYGLSRSYVDRTPFDAGFDPTSLGFPTYLTDEAAARGLQFPRFNFSNGAGLGTNGYVTLQENPLVHDFTASVTKIVGSQNIKIGGEFRKLFLNFYQYGDPDGYFDFNTSWTQQLPGNANGTGSPFADFMLGLPDSGYITQETTAASASAYMAFYFQDDWKVTRNLTLNLGLRWDVDLPRSERYNQYSFWNPTAPSPLQGKVPADACSACGNLLGAMEFVGVQGAPYGRSQGPTQWLDFGPRVGFAYTPRQNGKFVMRGGFGISYLPSALQASGTSGASGMEGFSTQTNMLVTTDNYRTISATLSNPFPTGFVQALGAAGGPGTDIGNGIGESFFDSYRNPYVMQWNFNMQYQLPWGIIVQAGYLGNHSLFLVDGDPGLNYDQLPTSDLALGNALYNSVPNPFYGIITTPGSPLSAPTVTYNQLLRPYPQYNGVMSFRKPTATSVYDAVIAKIEKRFSNGITFIGSFTGGKLMDNSAAAVTYLGPTSGTREDEYNGRLEWSISPQDVSKAFVGSFVYDLPFGRGKQFLSTAPKFVNLLVAGWQANGIVFIQDGTPIVMGAAQNETGIFTLNQRPDNTGQSAELAHPTIQEWFDTSVFYQPPPFTLGTTSRTLPDVRNPPYRDADLSLFKNNYFGNEGHYNLQFRIEAFNALNHVNFNGPNTSILAGSAFGTITSDVQPRQVQLAAKFYF